jgi:hypothetical protein
VKELDGLMKKSRDSQFPIYAQTMKFHFLRKFIW